MKSTIVTTRVTVGEWTVELQHGEMERFIVRRGPNMKHVVIAWDRTTMRDLATAIEEALS